MHDQVRQMIRSIIAQELATRGGKSSPSSEPVRIDDDEDLAGFVLRIARLCDDTDIRQSLLDGSLRFRLHRPASGTDNHARSRTSTNTGARFLKGVLTERECEKLDTAINGIVLGKHVRITPLASDWLRRNGISTTREES